MSEEIKFGSLNITENDRTKTKDFGKDKGAFQIIIPLPVDRAQITTSIAKSLGGLKYDNFPPDEYKFVQMIVTLNYVISSSPDWWDGAEKCPDNSFLFKLWDFYLESEISFSKFLKKNS